MELQSVTFFYKRKMVASMMAELNFKWLYLNISNLERVCVRFYGSINLIESFKLPSVNYLDESKMATSKMAVSKMASFFVLCRSTALSPQSHSTTILD